MANAAERTYTTGQVARALGVPPRRLKGWVERRVLSPRIVRGRTRRGDRREYRWSQVLAAAVIAEVQMLLGGANFQPGVIAKLVPMAGLVAAITNPAEPALLVYQRRRGKAVAEIVYNPQAVLLPQTALVVNLTRLGQRLREALASEA